MQATKIISITILVNIINADLIGFNRAANNVKNHIEGRVETIVNSRTRKSVDFAHANEDNVTSDGYMMQIKSFYELKKRIEDQKRYRNSMNYIMKDFLGFVFLILSTEEETINDFILEDRLMKWPHLSSGLTASLQCYFIVS